MAAKNRRKQRRQRTNKKADAKQKEDRLSSLPDDILIGILDRLPLPQAIATGSLSRRWLGLWTNLTTIQLSNRKYDSLLEFFSAFDDIMTYITSPVIHKFSFELVGMDEDDQWTWLLSIESKLRQICERNVRELKVTFQVKHPYYRYIDKFPSVVFRMQSLVSVEFCSTVGWQLPKSINLPNLKNLTLYSCPRNFNWFEKLTKACPSLEQVSLNYEDHPCDCMHLGIYNIECSNRNLRRLFINFEESEYLTFRINAPKIEYLSVRAPKSTFCSFGEKPIVLREVNIELTDVKYDPAKVDYELMSKFYEDISNARFLSLYVFALDNFPTTLLRKATNLTLDMNRSNEMKIALSSFLELCPLLDTLTLKFFDFGRNEEKWILSKPYHVSVLPQGLKTIKFETYWYTYCKPAKSFLDLLDYFLKRATCLEHFKVDARGCVDYESGSVESKQTTELMLSNLLFHCPTTSIGCEVEFVGRFFRMSRKVGPKVTSLDGEVIPFSHLPRHIFCFYYWYLCSRMVYTKKKVSEYYALRSHC